MTHSLQQTWRTWLVLVIAALYAWVGVSLQGPDQLLGLIGAPLIVAALVVAPRSRPTAAGLLLLGALPSRHHHLVERRNPATRRLVPAPGLAPPQPHRPCRSEHVVIQARPSRRNKPLDRAPHDLRVTDLDRTNGPAAEPAAGAPLCSCPSR